MVLKLQHKQAYSREEYTDPLKIALGVISGTIPFIKSGEMLLIGLETNSYSGYAEVDNRVKVACEEYLYREIKHYPH